jgi:hypothetical protein
MTRIAEQLAVEYPKDNRARRSPSSRWPIVVGDLARPLYLLSAPRSCAAHRLHEPVNLLLARGWREM